MFPVSSSDLHEQRELPDRNEHHFSTDGIYSGWYYQFMVLHLSHSGVGTSGRLGVAVPRIRKRDHV